jgi:hypothetical protein
MEPGNPGPHGAPVRSGELQPKLKERDAADIIHALMSPEVYRLLVCDRGWHPDRYEQWLKDTLISQLLPPPVTAGAPAPSSAGCLLTLLLVIRDAQRAGTWPRLRACGNPGCRRAFCGCSPG